MIDKEYRAEQIAREAERRLVNLCETCRPSGICWPYVGEFAHEGQEPTDVCGKYRKRVDTNWERLFGTPERTARTIVENCESDCYACIMYDAPCFGRFGLDEEDVPMMLGWLESEVDDE